MNDALRRKLEAWVEFYGDMEIDLIDRRRAVAGENPPAASLEKVVEELSFEGPDLKKKTIRIDAKFVNKQLIDIVKDQDLSRYIL